MKLVMQRVLSAHVEVEGKVYSRIGPGLLVYLGIAHGDGQKEIDYLVRKAINLRIFNDQQQKMNLSLVDLEKDILIVSQFTLYADTRKGNRPSFVKAAPPEMAKELYNDFVSTLSRKLKENNPSATNGYRGNIKEGIFQEDMKIYSINDGPVTIVVES